MSRIKRSNKNHLTLAVFVGAIMALAALPAWAAVKLQLDRDRVMVGETVTLTFVSDDARQSFDADLSALQENFEILDNRTERQMSIVNGSQTTINRMLLTVEPKHDGDIQIPSFRFGDSSTRPVLLRVDPAPELAPGELPPVFIEVELTPGEGPYYVHAQFGLVMRLFYLQSLTEAAISKPAPAPASARLLQETPYNADRGGKRYKVMERHYAIFPERSGELLIPSIRLTGRLVERQSNGIWKQAVRGRRVRAESDEILLKIDPKPAEFTGESWQPAREFRIAQQVSSADALRVGEPVTRTVMIDAVGLEENMITEPEWPEIEDARIYPDQPQGITRDDGRWVLGHKEFRYAVVPEAEGELVLPELKVDWWDTRNGVLRTAVLPAHTLQVLPSQLVPQSGSTPVPQDEVATRAFEPIAAAGAESVWKWVALLFAVLWAATLIWAWRLGNGGGPSNNGAASGKLVSEKESELLQALRRASDNNDPASARRALQRWLRDFGPTGNSSLLEFAAVTGDDALRATLYRLDSTGFDRGGEERWDGKTLWKQFEAWRKKASAKRGNNAAPLTDLYARENRVTPAT